MNVLEKEDEELAEAVVEEIEELDIEDLDEFSQGLEEEFEIQHLQVKSSLEPNLPWSRLSLLTLLLSEKMLKIFMTSSNVVLKLYSHT